MLIYGENGVIVLFIPPQNPRPQSPEGTDALPVFALQFKIVYFRSVIWLQRKVKY